MRNRQWNRKPRKQVIYMLKISGGKGSLNFKAIPDRSLNFRAIPAEVLSLGKSPGILKELSVTTRGSFKKECLWSRVGRS